MGIEALTDPEDFICVKENSVKVPVGTQWDAPTFGHCGPNGTSMTLRPSVGRSQSVKLYNPKKQGNHALPAPDGWA